MSVKNKIFAVVALIFFLNLNIPNFSAAGESARQEIKYPDYGYEFLGEDKFENFNRKMFKFNSKLNKYMIKPVHIVWASIIPKYGMDRIQSVYMNIEYPKRLVSTLVQRDFKSCGTETVRFLTNTTIGLGGLYDPAKSVFHIEPVQENLEQALCKCKCKQGPYLVVPGLVSCTPRSLAGRLLECPLDVAMYLGGPITAMVKAGFLVNRTAYMQPVANMLECTYADPYDVARKLYGIENYIKSANLDRHEILETDIKIHEMVSLDCNDIETYILTHGKLEDGEKMVKAAESLSDESKKEIDDNLQELNISSDKVAVVDITRENGVSDNIILTDVNPNNPVLYADIFLLDYNPQNPVIDSMRTALYDNPEINKSIWAELSVWNRCFAKRIKTSSVNIVPERENYKYKFILQKDRTAPMAVIYPSIGEGISTHHAVVMAKMFYDEGYSVVIQGSHFHWEFVKSMPKEYRPGFPANDAQHLRMVTGKILESLQEKYNVQPREKLVLGTSFGAMTTLFLADIESKDNTLNIDKFISINPPIELVHALKELDKNNECWCHDPEYLKHKLAIIAAKIIHLTNLSCEEKQKLKILPFSDEEARLITGFILRQKLSDLILTLEETNCTKKCCNIYSRINNMSYRNYAENYLLSEKYPAFESLHHATSLHSIKDTLKDNDKYKIYHTLDDYFSNKEQLKKLKEYCGSKIVILSNGSHLGFLYRQEFLDELKKDISLSSQRLTRANE